MDKLKSRKLWVTIGGAALAALADEMGWDRETIFAIAGMVASYVVGQGIVDKAEKERGY